jgi:large subunit ribosomal protein L24
MKIHTGDLVTIIAGKDKGKQGSVVRVLAEKGRVIVEGINMRTRHIKKTPQAAGQRVVYEASIHASNVMVLDPKTKKPTRIGYTVDVKTGDKKRIAKASGEIIEKAVTKAEKGPKKEMKTTKGTKGTEGTEVKKTSAPSAPSAASTSLPKKQPFWKRKDATAKDGTTGSKGDSGGTSFTTAHRSQGG